jgi:hypothetical protein
MSQADLPAIKAKGNFSLPVFLFQHVSTPRQRSAGVAMRAFFTFLLGVQACVLGASPVPDYPFICVRGGAEKVIAPNKTLIAFQIASYSTNASAIAPQLTIRHL